MPSLQKNPQWGVTSKQAFLIFIQGDIIIFKNFRHYITEISVMKFQKFHQEISEIMKFQKFQWWNFITKFLKDEISEISRWNFITEISEISIKISEISVMIEISENLIEISEISIITEISLMKFHHKNFCDEISEISWWNFWFFSTEISDFSAQKFHHWN